MENHGNDINADFGILEPIVDTQRVNEISNRAALNKDWGAVLLAEAKAAEDNIDSTFRELNVEVNSIFQWYLGLHTLLGATVLNLGIDNGKRLAIFSGSNPILLFIGMMTLLFIGKIEFELLTNIFRAIKIRSYAVIAPEVLFPPAQVFDPVEMSAHIAFIIQSKWTNIVINRLILEQRSSQITQATLSLVKLFFIMLATVIVLYLILVRLYVGQS